MVKKIGAAGSCSCENGLQRGLELAVDLALSPLKPKCEDCGRRITEERATQCCHQEARILCEPCEKADWNRFAEERQHPDEPTQTFSALA